MTTTLFLSGDGQTHRKMTTPCHGGEGEWYFRDLLAPLAASEILFIKFIHDDIIPPGSTFGAHCHGGDAGGPEEEWYYCLSGRGVMMLDGREHEMTAGDLAVCYAGGCHGLRNTGSEAMRIIVICASPCRTAGQEA